MNKIVDNRFSNNANNHFNQSGNFGVFGQARPDTGERAENSPLQVGMTVNISNIDVKSEILPPGIYNFRVTKAELADHFCGPNGKIPDCTKIRVNMQLLDPLGKVAFATENFFLVNMDWPLRKLRKFYISLGMLEENATSMKITTDVVGKYGRAKVSTATYEGKDGQKYDNNHIDDFVPLDPDDPIPDGMPMKSAPLPF